MPAYYVIGLRLNDYVIDAKFKAKTTHLTAFLCLFVSIKSKSFFCWPRRANARQDQFKLYRVHEKHNRKREVL